MSETPTYGLRELCSLNNNALWAIPDGKIVVRCDDGDFITTTHRMRYTVFLIRDFYELYPLTATRTGHMLANGRRIGKMVHANLLNTVVWDVFDTYTQRGQEVDTEHLAQLAYQGTNRLYNEMSYKLAAHVQSLSILDFIDVIHHPKIKEAQEKIQPTTSSIERVYNTIIGVLKDPVELPNNRLSNIVRSGLVDENQVVQCVGPRGFTTDIDSYIFKTPILVGFTHGFHLFYDSLVDSRLAAKAQSFTGPPLQATEYFNRQLQLLAQTFIGIQPGDCGTTETKQWRVRAKDLARLDGKYYVTDVGLMRVDVNSHDLVGKVIELRTPTKCALPNSQFCCQACYGEMAHSIPRNTNIGHVAATNLGEKISQSVLAIKHVETSSAVGSLELDDFAKRFIRASFTDANLIHLAERLSRADKVEMSFQAREAPHLTDVHQRRDPSELPLSFISELSEVMFEITVNGKTEKSFLPVYLDNRPASLSYALLNYIKTDLGNLLRASDDGTVYTMDLTKFDPESPLFEMPRFQVNMLDYAESIKDFLCAAKRKNSGKTLRDFDNVDAALDEFYALVSSRLKVNYVHLEVLIRSTMVRSRHDRDYRLPLAGNKIEFGEFTNTMYMRSISAAMAYQGQKQALEKPLLYLIHNRPSHPLDRLFVPNLPKKVA